MKKRLLSFAIAVCMIFGCTAVLPEGAFDDYIALFTSAQVGTDYEEIHKYKEVEYTVETLDLKDYRSSFTYNDDMFNVDSEKESTDLAKMSVGLAMAAYDEKVIRDCFDNMGFKYTDDTLVNYEDEKLSDYDNCDFVAFSIANKITTFNNEEYNIVVVPIRGTHGDVEWFSDFNLGLGNDHAGFYAAAGEVETKLKSFLDNYKQFDSDHTIILTTGHSRGAAVANIVAGMYSTASRYKNYVKQNHIFAYTFACPSVSTKADTSLKNIYNYNNCGDVITALPLEEWGFKRFGQTKVLEARGIEYANFQIKFFEASGINYAGMTTTDPWVDTFRTLASSQKEFNDPDRQLLFKLVAVTRESNISSTTRKTHFNRVMGDYVKDGGSIANYVLMSTVFSSIINQISVETGAIIAAIVSACEVTTGISGSLHKCRIEVDLEAYIESIDNMLKETKDCNSEQFAEYIKNHSSKIDEIENITQVSISSWKSLEIAKNSFSNAKICFTNFGVLITKIVSLFFASRTDPNNPNADGMLKALEHGHTPLTYILWINSIYYGANGWSRNHSSIAEDLLGLVKAAPESIPDNITTLGFGCFRQNNDLDSVDIPIGVKYISSCCFDSCLNLKQLSIPYTVDVMGGWAFHNCTGLKNVSMPCDLPRKGLLGDLNSYYPCFRGCTNIKNIHYTYGRTGKMRDLTDSNEMNYSPERESCNSLTTISFDDDITHIGKYSFNYVTSLSSVRLPTKLKSIGDFAFRMCSSLKHIELPSTLETLGNNCFDSSGLVEILIPAKVTELPQDCFSSCANLTSLVIPETVTKIKGCAFDNCIGLRNVTIACDLPTIGTWGDENSYYPCFGGCTNIKNIHYTYGRSGVMVDSDSDKSLAHQAGESLRTVIFDDEITHIGKYSFNYVTSLTSVSLPSKLKSIGECAFRMCTSLKNIDLPNSLESIGEYCFASSGIENVKIPPKMTTIPSYCFDSCKGLTSLVIPDTVTRIYGLAFNNCTGLKSVTIPCDLSTIGTYGDENSYYPCFGGCTNIKNIHYTYGRTGKMRDKTNYELDKSIENESCLSLTTVSFDDNITHIGDNAFCYNTALNNVKLPSKINSIGTYAFYNCSGLTKITIPNSIQNINAYAFHRCDELKTVIYNGHKQEWDRISIGEHNEPLENVQFKPCEHNYTAVVTTPATCTTDGVRTYTCSKCNDSYIEIINAAGHKLGEWIVTTKPTCTVKGVETRKCENCDKSEIRDADALGHDYVETVVSPTCTTKGYTNHKCSRCNDEYNDTETDMVAHKFGEWIVTTKPTCTAKGVETSKCENCDKTETREVNALGHKYGDWDIKSYESKTGVSKLERKCINCTHYESKTEKNTVLRYAGAGRFATAAEISKATFDSAKTVVLAYGLNYADALAGVPLAAKNDAPILLTNTKTLPQETLAEIKRLKAANVIILGGEGAIGSGVENLLKKEGLTTQRIAGKTRFSTATAIAEQLTETPEEIFFVYAFNFADALSASTVAAIKGAPIIYLKTNGDIDADTAAYLAKVKGKVKKAYVIGGTGVISDDMMNKAKNALGLDTITRVAGANRYATCIEVNSTFKDYLTGNGICVAKGLDFPDALAGGVFAALKKMPLFLADGNLKDVQTGYLGNKDISNVYVFGGTGAVPNDLVERIAKAS